MPTNAIMTRLTSQYARLLLIGAALANDNEIRMTAYRDNDGDCSGAGSGWDHSIRDNIKSSGQRYALMNPEGLEHDDCASGASVSFMGSCNDTNINVTYFSAPDCAGSVSSVATYDDGACVPDTGSDTGSRRYIKFECVGTPAFPVAAIIGGTVGVVLALVLATLHDQNRKGGDTTKIRNWT